MNGIEFQRVQDEQRLEGDDVVTYVTALVRIDRKGPFFYRVVKSPNWAAELRLWADQQAAELRALMQ